MRSGRDCLATGAVVDVAALTHRIGLDAVGRALFSADLSGRRSSCCDATSDAAELVVRVGPVDPADAAWAPTPTNLRLRSTRRRLDAISVRADRAATRAWPADASGSRGDDLLGLLLDSRPERRARYATSWSPW